MSPRAAAALALGLFGIIHGSGADAAAAPQFSSPLLEIAYRPVGKLIYVPVRINGGASRWFCVDSGAPMSILDRAAAERASIRPRKSGTIQGAGKGDVRADFAVPVSLTIGKLTTLVEPRIIDLAPVELPVPPAGLVGAEFFEKYVVRIDTDRHRIAFFDPKKFRAPPRAASVPLELTNHRLYVQLRLEPRPGTAALRRLRVDTGSEDSVDDDSVRQSAEVTETRLGNGLGSSYVGYSGIYSSVSIGPYKFANVWGPAGAVPIVGMEIMRRFTLTFDTAAGILYLEPNRHLQEPVPPPSSGRRGSH